MAANELQPNDRTNEGGNKKQPVESSGFFEKQDSDNDGTHGSDARPYSICGTHWKGLCSFIKQVHAASEAYQKAQ